jgi:hypothetical protein
MILNKNKWIRAGLGIALGASFLLAAGSPALADRDFRENCRTRLEADRARIDRDAARFGEGSRAVERDLAKMDSDRNWCRSHRADWDHSRFDIGVYLHR